MALLVFVLHTWRVVIGNGLIIIPTAARNLEIHTNVHILIGLLLPLPLSLRAISLLSSRLPLRIPIPNTFIFISPSPLIVHPCSTVHWEVNFFQLHKTLWDCPFLLLLILLMSLISYLILLLTFYCYRNGATLQVSWNVCTRIREDVRILKCMCVCCGMQPASSRTAFSCGS